MKRKMGLFLLSVMVFLSLIGCSEKQEAEKQVDKVTVKTEGEASNESKTSEDKKQKEELKQPKQETENPVTEETETNTVSEESKQENKTEPEKEPDTSGQSQDGEKESQTTVITPTKSPTEPPKAEEPPKTEEPLKTPEEPKATANDCRAVADKVLEYINSYRSTPATKLPGLTHYAEYRSRQLIGNFAHDTLDERAAATALQYGTYIDPTLYGITGEPYYAAGAREAIAKAGYAGSIDYVAKSIANLVKNSTGHWAYVGCVEYCYIAVGITYESGMWYCDIAVATENTDNK